MRKNRKTWTFRLPPRDREARLQEVNAFLKHVDLMLWEMDEHAVMSLGGYIVYVLLKSKRTGVMHTFNRFDEEGIEELRRLTSEPATMA